MNLVEALKTGRPFKRARWINYIDYRGIRATSRFWTDDALQDDWEVEPKARVFILDPATGYTRPYADYLPHGWILVREVEK